MSNIKDMIVVPKPVAARIWVTWTDGAWGEFHVAGRLLNSYPPLEDHSALVDRALSMAKIG